MKRPVLVSLLVVSLLVGPATVSAAFVDPNFQATVPEPTVTPGETQNVTILLRNEADEADDAARTARNVVATVQSADAPITVRSGPRLLGTVSDDEVAAVTVSVTVPENVSAGTYRLPVTLRYVVDQADHIDVVRPTVRVEPRPRLQIVDVDSAVGVDDRGTVSVTVQNVGEHSLSDGALRLSSTDGTLQLGGERTASRYLGPLAPGQRKTRTYVVSATGAARPQRYALNVSATYEGPDGIRTRHRVGTARVIPAPNQTFSARAVEDDAPLRAGEEGTVRVAVTNDGPARVTDTDVSLTTPSEAVRVREAVAPVGNLSAGESTVVAFPVTVSADADTGPRRFAATVRYRTANGTEHRSDDLVLTRSVAPERDRITVAPQATTVGIDVDERVTVTVANVWDRRLTDVTATVAAAPPFESESPRAYVASLDPGEERTLAFGLTVSEDAVPTTTSVAVNVTGETPDGDRVSLGTHHVPVTVTEDSATQSAMVTLALGAIVVLVLLGIGGWWLRR